MKKTLSVVGLYITVGVCLFSFASCKNKEQKLIGTGHRTPNLISCYISNPSLRAEIVANGNNTIIISIEKNKASSKALNRKIYPTINKQRNEEYYHYANKYGDTNYKGTHIMPNQYITLAEAIEKIRCYGFNNMGERIELTNNSTISGESYLPFIKSGYDVDLLQETYGMNYWVAYPFEKHLNETTKKDLNLPVIDSSYSLFKLILPKESSTYNKLTVEVTTEGKTQILEVKNT